MMPSPSLGRAGGVYGLGAHPGLRDGDGGPGAAGAERTPGGRKPHHAGPAERSTEAARRRGGNCVQAPARPRPPSGPALHGEGPSPRCSSPPVPYHPPDDVCRLLRTPSTNCNTTPRRYPPGDTARQCSTRHAGRPGQHGSSLQPNNACGSPAGCSSQGARTARSSWWISVSSRSSRGNDEPEILSSSRRQICISGPDAGQPRHLFAYLLSESAYGEGMTEALGAFPPKRECADADGCARIPRRYRAL